MPLACETYDRLSVEIPPDIAPAICRLEIHHWLSPAARVGVAGRDIIWDGRPWEVPDFQHAGLKLRRIDTATSTVESIAVRGWSSSSHTTSVPMV